MHFMLVFTPFRRHSLYLHSHLLVRLYQLPSGFPLSLVIQMFTNFAKFFGAYARYCKDYWRFFTRLFNLMIRQYLNPNKNRFLHAAEQRLHQRRCLDSAWQIVMFCQHFINFSINTVSRRSIRAELVGSIVWKPHHFLDKWFNINFNFP